ncbi:protein ROLLING AND ERECT LEAF 2-like [Prosopis cineraria]|uniref:protein ROLLING AND ERECT LEAF 2-like n=1 Tax=Prosopis cineraria TaxID=364024 RepID=UPI00240ED413|nr:protein ROLLING AND ERECT LEAF 2-like [Prosopis cineraria]
MGCTQSKIENEEAVARCKERKQFMKDAVSARNAFAAAHTSYATYLKNTGAALSDFVQGEVQNPQSASGVAALPSNPPIVAPIPPFEIPLPPPPLPNFPPSPLQRAATMPEIKITKQETTPVGPIIEEVENEMENEGSLNGGLRKRGSGRRSGSGHSRSGTKEMMEEEADRPPMPPPPSKPEPQVETHLHTMSDQTPQNSTWEYFFFPPIENVPGTSLRGEEEDGLSKEENEKATFDEKPNRLDEDVEQSMRNEKDEVPEPQPAPVPKPEKVVEPPEPPEPPVALATPVGKGLNKGKHGQVPTEGKRIVKSTVNLIEIFTLLDDDFLKASESAHEVSKMLEATRLHYHSNFADNRGHIDHSARVMRVITWNRSFKGMPNLDDGTDDLDYDEDETHATILDKLLAWEKKLYDEVKAGELMKFEYQKKVASLNKLKKRGTNTEALEKAKASVSHLHTRYIVDMQSLDSTVSEIASLRDEQLYPRLVNLVDGMATMWKTMHDHHEKQYNVVMLLKTLDSQSSSETSEHHHDRTYQLLVVVQGWCSQFDKLVTNQKGYIKALNNWLKLNLLPIESNFKEMVSSPPRVRNPPIQGLIQAWHDHLETLPDQLARAAMSNFAAMVETIFHLQQEEIALKRKCEELRKELARKTRQFRDWHDKYLQRKIPDEPDADRPESINATDEIVVEKQFLVEQVQRRLEQEEDAHRRQYLQVRQKSLGSLKSCLPELFRAMSEFALECSKMYRDLRSISQNLNTGPISS